MLTLYKWLGKDQMSYHGGKGRWPEPGVWFEVRGEIVPCHRGLHLCRKKDLPHWIGPTLWKVEYAGELIEHENKVVASKARLVRQLKWSRTEQIEFACRAAERQLPIFEKRFPFDMRPRDAIKAVRSKNAAYAAYAADAAADANAAAAYAKAAAAAAYAAYAAYAANTAAYAANAAAYAADAAAAAARKTERNRQSEDILELAGEVQ